MCKCVCSTHTELKPRGGGLTNFHIVIAYAGDLNAWGSSSAFCAANLNPSISRSLDPSLDAGHWVREMLENCNYNRASDVRPRYKRERALCFLFRLFRVRAQKFPLRVLTPLLLSAFSFLFAWLRVRGTSEYSYHRKFQVAPLVLLSLVCLCVIWFLCNKLLWHIARFGIREKERRWFIWVHLRRRVLFWQCENEVRLSAIITQREKCELWNCAFKRHFWSCEISSLFWLLSGDLTSNRLMFWGF